MSTTSIFATDIETKTSNLVFSSFIFHRDEGCLYYDESYQRPYCWTHAEQQALLKTIFSREPIDSVAIVINEGSMDKYCEMVDGRQRITTMLMFYDNKIPYITDEGKEIFYKDLSTFDKLEFKKLPMASVELQSRDGNPVPYESKVKFFYRKNFAGMPQSPEHKARIEQMMDEF